MGRRKQKTDKTDEDLIKRMEELNRGSLKSLHRFNWNQKNNLTEDTTKKNSPEKIRSIIYNFPTNL